jgi:hypothetical protein
MKLGSLLIVFLLPLTAQISPPREKPSDYPVHLSLPALDLAAEYLVHSLPSPKGVLFIKGYLIVEVAAYPTNLAGGEWKTSQFTLRINKKGGPITPESPGTVAASIKYPDWQQRPTATAQVGVDDKNVVFGQPTVGRFPGDPTTSKPLPSPVPEPESPTGEGREPELTIDQICLRQALHDGPYRKPVNGFLYFPFAGKLKSIHTLELIYESADGTQATLTLL